MAFAIVVLACLFFFIPTTLIVLGYYASQPTGTLISPLPQGILSDVGAQLDAPATSTVSPIIAAGNESTPSSASAVVPEVNSNIIDKTASISAGLNETIVSDPDIKATSQVYLSARENDKTIYSVKNKADGQVTISANQSSDTVRYVDYHIVNP